MSDRLRVHRVRVPLRVPVATAAAAWGARESWLLQVSDEDGRTGWGEVALEDAGEAAVVEGLLDLAVESGREPSAAVLGRAGAAGRAVAAGFAGAWAWAGGEVAGAGAPGVTGPAGWAAERGVGVNATIGAANTAATVTAALEAVDAGFRTLKLKAGPRDTTATLVERLALVRAEVGDEVALRLDVNGSWSLVEAEQRLRALAGFGLAYVEQPLAPGAIEAAAELRSRVGVALAADEAVESVDAARALLDAGAADVLVVKPGRVGGPAAVAAIAGLAAARGVPVVVSSLFETGIGLAAALASAAALPDVPGWSAAERDHGLATADLLVDDLLVRRLTVAKGRMRAPGGEGAGALGVAVDERAVARFTVDGGTGGR